MIATHKQIVKAFTEWDRRYRKDPEKFTSEYDHLNKETTDTYGAKAATYFKKVLKDIK